MDNITMKNYAVYLFDDDKVGLERYKYIEEMQTDFLEQDDIKFYYCRLIENVRLDKIAVNTLDMSIYIPISERKRIRYKNQTTAYIPGNGGKAIVVLERYPKEESK